MEITISKPFQNPNNSHVKDSYNLVCKIYGLKSDKFMEEDGGCIVDFSIIDIIIFLNKASYITFTCCSGLDADHNYEENEGYLAFGDLIDENQWQIIRKLGMKSGFYIDKQFHAIRIKGNDEYKRKAWTKFKHFIELNL